VSEAAVVAVDHDVKGNSLYSYITLATGVEPSQQLERELKKAVSEYYSLYFDG